MTDKTPHGRTHRYGQGRHTHTCAAAKHTHHQEPVITPGLHFEGVPSGVGGLEHRTERGFVAELWRSQDLPPVGSVVQFRRLQVELQAGDEFIVTGVGDGEVVMESNAGAGRKRKAKQDGDSDDDWLRAIRRHAAEPRRASRWTAPGGGARPPAPTPLQDAPFDDRLRELLDALDRDLAADGECDEPPGDDLGSESDASSVSAGERVTGPAAPRGEAMAPPPPEAVAEPPPASSNDIAGPASEPGFIRTCLDRFADTHDGDVVCEALGFARHPNYQIRRRADGHLAGHLRVTFQGQTLFAKCASHRECSNMVNIGGLFQAVEAWQIQWLIAGTACGAAEHAQLKAKVKGLRKAAGTA